MPMGRENRPLFAWYGDMELVPHLWEALKAGPIDVVVEFHPPMTVDIVGGRKALAALTETIVRRGQTAGPGGLAGRATVAETASRPPKCRNGRGAARRLDVILPCLVSGPRLMPG